MSVFDSFPDHLDEKNPAPHFLRNMDWEIAVDYVNNKLSWDEIKKKYGLSSRERVRQILVKVVDAVWGQKGRCATCKWWQKTWLKLPNHGECALIGSQNPRIANLTNIQNQAAFIADDEYDQNITTRADFGCVQWEPKA